MVKVHYGEGVATHTGPESCAWRRETPGEALTGVCVGQVVSGESNVVRGADAVVAAEGNRDGSDGGRIRTTPGRLGPWHAHTPPAREPGELRHRPARPFGGPQREDRKAIRTQRLARSSRSPGLRFPPLKSATPAIKKTAIARA